MSRGFVCVEIINPTGETPVVTVFLLGFSSMPLSEKHAPVWPAALVGSSQSFSTSLLCQTDFTVVSLFQTFLLLFYSSAHVDTVSLAASCPGSSPLWRFRGNSEQPCLIGSSTREKTLLKGCYRFPLFCFFFAWGHRKHASCVSPACMCVLLSPVSRLL